MISSSSAPSSFIFIHPHHHPPPRPLPCRGGCPRGPRRTCGLTWSLVDGGRVWLMGGGGWLGGSFGYISFGHIFSNPIKKTTLSLKFRCGCIFINLNGFWFISCRSEREFNPSLPRFFSKAITKSPKLELWMWIYIYRPNRILDFQLQLIP